MIEYVFDTYSLMEIIFGNENYLEFIEEDFIINEFIFAELCYNLIKIGHPKKEDYLKKYKEHIQNLNPNLINLAMEFRYKNKKKKLSMTDCISYIQSKELGIKFLTGDKEFENIDNVKFVK